MSISTIFKGANGEFENVRTLGVIGVLAYIICANLFQAWMIFKLHKDFDITAYCLAFPTGLGTAIAAIGLTAGKKEQQVAAAKATGDGNATV